MGGWTELKPFRRWGISRPFKTDLPAWRAKVKPMESRAPLWKYVAPTLLFASLPSGCALEGAFVNRLAAERVLNKLGKATQET